MNKIAKVLCVLLLYGLYACQQDEQTLAEETLQVESTTHTDVRGRTIETVNSKHISFLVDYIASQEAGYIQESGNRSEGEEINPFGTVDLDRIQALINDETAIDKTYTFAMTAPEHITDEFSNLIVRVIDGEIIRAYINVYTPTPEYLANYGLIPGSAYSGEINSYSLEGSGIDLGRSVINKLGEGLTPVKAIAFSDGNVFEVTISQDCDPPDTTDNNPPDTDPDSNTNTGGGGGEPDEPDNDHQDTGTTDHDPSGGDPTGPDGGGGGTSDCDFEIYVGCCNRNICEPHGPRLPQPLCTGSNAVVIDCSDDRSANTTGETVNVDHTDCPDDDVVVIGPPQEITIEDLCNEISDQINNDTDFQEAKSAVANSTNFNKEEETGKAQRTDGEFYDLEVNSRGTLRFNPTDEDVGFMHVHVNDWETGNFNIAGEPEVASPIRIFSPGDIRSFLLLARIARDNNQPIEGVFGYVYSSGRDYAFRYNGDTALLDNLINSLPLEEMNKLNTEYANLVRENNKEKGLLLFMRDVIGLNSGIELFQVKNNGNVTHLFLDNNENVDRENC